jgi:GntR family histidine utilization transcriptional repressor
MEENHLENLKRIPLRELPDVALKNLNSLTLNINSKLSVLKQGKQSTPLFQLVKDFIIRQIESGNWPPDTRIPSENVLIKQLSISRMTANRAMRELTTEGYLVRIQGLGTFVATPKVQYEFFTIKPISDEIAERGAVHSAKVHLLTEEKASPEIAEALCLEIGAPVFRSFIVHMANGVPVQLADRYVNPDVAPDFLKQDFTKTTPSHYLFQVGRLTKAEHIFEAILPDVKISKLLKINATEPCLLLNRRTWTYEKVASKARLIHPGSRFKIGGIFTPFSPLNPSVG